MDEQGLKNILQQVKRGDIDIDQAIHQMKYADIYCLGHTNIDNQRKLRQGYCEVIFGQGKTEQQLKEIAEYYIKNEDNLLITRLDANKAEKLLDLHPKSEYHSLAKLFTIIFNPAENRGLGKITVVSAGTSDQPVAQEAFLVAKFLGHRVGLIQDIGVAGLHRITRYLEELNSSKVLIVVAGMEGALASVIGGLVARPIIAVPTSVGYGANFQGLSALLSMLNSCAAGVCTVNIDNGFGAAMVAALINSPCD